MIKAAHTFYKKYYEVILWNGALIVLMVMNTDEGAASFCVLKNLGFSWCPGCGLGHAIHHALHFQFTKSIQEHVLGIPAAIVLFYQSCKSIYITNKINYNYGSTTITKNVS